MFASQVGIREVARSSANGLKTAMSTYELRYNEVHCHSLKLYPFLSSKIIMVSQNLDYCSRKMYLLSSDFDILYETDNESNRNTC